MPPPAFKLLFVAAVCLTSGLTRASHGEDVASCLRDADTACEAARDCAGADFGDDRSCLAAPIPWHTPYTRVRCCHRCCLAYWQHALGLDDVHAMWRDQVKHNGTNENQYLGSKKHGFPEWDEVLVSHMTPFAWAPLRALSKVFRADSSAGAPPVERARSPRAGEFAMLEGGYSELGALGAHDPWPAAVVVGTDAWLEPPPASGKSVVPSERRADVRSWLFSNVGGVRRDGVAVVAAPADVAGGGAVGTFPRALQTTTGWSAALADGVDARAPAARENLLLCGCCMKLREQRGRQLPQLRAQGFAYAPHGEGRPLSNYVGLFAGAKFVWSPRGHGWSNHRDWEALTLGAVPVLDHHPGFDDLYGQ